MTPMCIAAANYIIEKTNEYNHGKSYSERISMTCKRLQKLLYFSDIQYMKENNGTPMLRDDFHAWPSGPVIPSVYDKFMQYQSGEMIPISGTHTPITHTMKEAIDHIFALTVDIDTFDLVAMSHIDGGPWSTVFNDSDINHEQIISKEAMWLFYKDRNILSKNN